MPLERGKACARAVFLHFLLSLDFLLSRFTIEMTMHTLLFDSPKKRKPKMAKTQNNEMLVNGAPSLFVSVNEYRFACS